MTDLDQVISQAEQESKASGAFSYLPEIIEALQEYRDEQDATRKNRLASGVSRLVMEDMNFAESELGSRILQLIDT